MIDAESGNVSGNQAADIEFVVGLKDEFGVAREKSSLQAVGGTVDLLQRCGEVVVRLDGHDRRKNFLAIHFHVGLGAGKHGRLEQRAFAVATAEQTRTTANRLLYPFNRADSVTFSNQRAEIARFIEWIAYLQF